MPTILYNRKFKPILEVGFLIGILFVISGCSDSDLPEASQESSQEVTSEVVNDAPDEKNIEELNKNDEEKEIVEEVVIPESYDLDMPFQPQAPHGNWDMPYQEGCEEASAILATTYLDDKNITAEEMNQEILNMVEWQNKMWGGHYDLNVRETGDMMTGYYEEKYDLELLYDFTWDDIKKEIAAGHPVILPCAGQELGNPYYTSPGPVYHMLVVKGYTPDYIITNDVGTKRGADYKYDYNTLYNAVSDWETGRKAAIVVK